MGAPQPDWLPDLSEAQISNLLHDVLKTSGYVDSGIQEVLDPTAAELVLPADSAPPTRANTLLRLFFMQKSVSIPQATEALQPLSLEALVRTRYLRYQDDRVCSLIRVEPYGHLLVARPRDVDLEHKIMSISPATLELSNFTFRRHSRRTLDLGTGSGLQALLAAAHSDVVCAVDINPWAVGAADFNARWNGLNNVHCRLGSMFEPVAGEKFDLIVSNPPFVVSPGIRFRYRDSGIAGDKFAIGLARQAPSFLNEGGYLQMMLQWIETGDETWHEKLTGCLSDLGCDVWVLRTQTETPEAYVAGWLRANSEKPDAYDASQSEWLRYLEELDVRCIGTGLVTMQRRSGRNCIWFDEAPDDRSQPYGSAIGQVFAARQHLDGMGERALLDQKLTVSPFLQMIQRSRIEKNGWGRPDAEFELQAGLRYSYDNVDPVLAKIVAMFDGQLSIANVLKHVASQNGVGIEQLAERYLQQLRELTRYGFLGVKTINQRVPKTEEGAKIA